MVKGNANPRCSKPSANRHISSTNSRSLHNSGKPLTFSRTCSVSSAKASKTTHLQAKPQTFSRPATAPSATESKTYHLKGKPQTISRPASVFSTSASTTPHQKGKPQTLSRPASVPSSFLINKQHYIVKPKTFCSSATVTSSPVTTRHRPGKPTAFLHPATVSVSHSTINKPQHQKWNKKSSRPVTAPAIARKSETRQQIRNGAEQVLNGKNQSSLPFAKAIALGPWNVNLYQSGSAQTTRPSSVPTSGKIEKKQSIKGNAPVSVPNLKNVSCLSGSRRFSDQNELSQHQRDKHGSKTPAKLNTVPAQKGSVSCSRCKRSFHAKESLLQHQRDAHKMEKHPLSSSDTRKRSYELTADKKASNNPNQSQQTEMLRAKRKKEIDEFYKSKIDINKDEKKASVKIVDDTLFKIMSHVQHQKGGEIYCPNHIKAGSYPVNTKIGKADEFDTNIPLKLGKKDVSVRRDGKITYAYLQNEHSTNMNVKCGLTEVKNGPRIPDGHAVASVRGGIIPDTLRRGSDVLPREMRQDLYQKIKTAINDLHLNHVHLSRDSHGPALTMTIHPNKHTPVKHNISVDVTVSLPCDEPIQNWPRKETKRAFSEKLINDVKETGTHLVPKKDEFWSVSFSKAERELFSRIDEGNGCRRFVYKMLKKHLQTCKSRSKNDLPGLSSHVLKTQLLWSCEKHSAEGYWNHDNRDLCLIDAMSDLEKTLRSGSLPDYFNKNVEILKGKDRADLQEMANHLRDEKCKLKE